MPTLGLALLILATLSALTGVGLGIWRPSPRAVKAAQALTAAASLGALAVLAALVAVADPRVYYALEHCAPADSGMGYRVSAVWAGQAGGLLLWCVETALVALGVSALRQARALGILMGIQTCMLGLVVLNNPFAPPPAGFEGGLNPMLMHPMMLIHPPMLFLGYALLAVPFAVTLGALWEGTPQAWALQVRPWLLLSWIALTAGNGFGAEWAYKTFGWGGYWAWDPVENTSFVPWMLCLAACHAIWIARRDGRWWPPAVAFALGGFLTVLYGSFLARSGLLSGASVHAYVSGESTMVYALGTVLVASTIAAIALWLRARGRWRAEAEATAGPVPVIWGVIALASMAIVVLVGMSLPMMGLAPGTSAYNAMTIPFAAIAFAVLGLQGLRLGARAASVAALTSLALAAASAVVFMVALSGADPARVPILVQTILAPVLAVGAAAVVAEAARQLLGRGPAFVRRGGPLAHLGAGLFLLGAIIAGCFTRSAEGYVQPGESTWLAGYQLNVRALHQDSPERESAELDVNGRRGEVVVESNEKFNDKLRHPWISREAWGDLYVTPLVIVPEPALLDGQEVPPGVMVEFRVKPGMPLVWIGMLLMAAGLFAALARRALEARAAATAAEAGSS